MIHPRIDELLDERDSRYALVIVAAKRARQINNYHHQLGEGMGFEEAPPPLVESRSKNYLTMSLEEISQGKIKYEYPKKLTLSGDARCRGHNVAVARILLGVTGGIAAYKACELLRAARRAGTTCCRSSRPAPSASSRPRPSTRSRASPQTDDPYPHLTRADALVIAPLTANTLAKLAHGLADNVLTEAALAHRGPFLVAPGDEHAHVGAPGDAGEPRAPAPAGRGLVGPEEGELAEGEAGRAG